MSTTTVRTQHRCSASGDVVRARVALRLDDVHGGTPVELLETLAQRVWRGWPVTYGVIPFPARLPGAEFLQISDRSRASLANDQLCAHLDAAAAQGTVEVGVHGLTHTDQPGQTGRARAELVAPQLWRVQRLLRALHEFRDRFGATALIPPHNFIDPRVAELVLAGGFTISRALMDTDVTALGLDPAAPGARAEAKRRRPAITKGSAAEIFQTVAAWAPGTRRQNQDAATLADETMAIIAPAGAGVITLHWWDFLRPDGRLDEDVVAFASTFLDECHRLNPLTTCTMSELGQHLCRGSARGRAAP